MNKIEKKFLLTKILEKFIFFIVNLQINIILLNIHN